MISSFKNKNFLPLMFILFAQVGFLQHFLLPNFNQYYTYAYIGIALISIISIYTVKLNSKHPFLLYVYTYFEFHFISVLIIIGDPNLSNFFLVSAILASVSLLRGYKGLILATVLALVNLLVTIIIANILNIAPERHFLIYLLDGFALFLLTMFTYFITQSYENTFRHLEEAHQQTSKNNQLLNNTIAELSTLQEISRFANSVLNIKELINIINDAIIGVIGVNYCSIFLIDETTGKFYSEATNIRDKNILQNIKLTIASKYYSQFKSRGVTVLEGKADDIPNYPSAAEREIKTFLITSLQSHRNFLGLIVLEACFDGAFEERKKNMINTICNQVSIAIENAVIYQKMERLATIDGLTQVHNRRYFNEMCLSQFANPSTAAPISIAMIDIDNFKKVNDTYGHLLGDAVLKNVASIISSTTCASNSEDFLVARYGGEEFVIFMKNTDLKTAYNTLEVVRKNIEASSVEDDEQKIRFTVSIGVAEFPATSIDVRQILMDADTALYKAKQTGKNKVVLAPSLTHDN